MMYIIMGAVGAGLVIVIAIIVILILKMRKKNQGSYTNDVKYKKGETA